VSPKLIINQFSIIKNRLKIVNEFCMVSSKLRHLINNIPNLIFKFPIIETLNMTLTCFKCKQCGKCCLNLRDAFETCASKEDIQRRKKERRDDIVA